MIANSDSIFRYWGKANPTYSGEPKWHPLAFHSLDVASVAICWWETAPALRERFMIAFNDNLPTRLHAWMPFFVALHDLGKFDLRFQLKAPGSLEEAWRRLDRDRDHAITQDEIQRFDHGRAGMVWGYRELPEWVDLEPEVIRARWKNWLAAVTGHHGDYYEPGSEGIVGIEADNELIEHDRMARRAWISELEVLFLHPAGLTLRDFPPACSLSARALLAGFCAVCDWIGSNAAEFDYRTPGSALPAYLNERQQQIRDRHLLERFGLVSASNRYAGLTALLGPGENPRGVQTVIDALPTVPGLTLIEAPTGSGKTETALAYAWRLLEAGVADSIVFALPTQATANAMLARVEAFAERAFGRANVVLAHGKRQFSEAFQELVERGQLPTAQGSEEASVQCAAWLANSRKLVFLGQVGVCTVDQVLLSVLPVRHKFMRGFGLNKSVLIIDEVHAYDAYMHGLLGEVLKNQKACGGSALLLSATLPSSLRGKLLGAWDAHGPDDAPYPALWHATDGETIPHTVSGEHRPPHRDVDIECLKLPGAYPDSALLGRIVAAAETGARIGIVVNQVDDAQRLARVLREQTFLDIDIFHARYRFKDRQYKEKAVIDNYGRHAARKQGRILVATQVVEQSLDLDFDWLLTHICPVDLLFQRLGRLHRHMRQERPAEFERPKCTVMTVEGEDYGVFELIYGNARVLWRTQKLLEQTGTVIFPEAYRDWIGRVYDSDCWEEEPDAVYASYLSWKGMHESSEARAIGLTTMPYKTFRDEESEITSLTRDGEMSLSVLPVTTTGSLLDSRRIEDIASHDIAEEINLNIVPCPASWKKILNGCPMETEGPLTELLQLVLAEQQDGSWINSETKLRYTKELGLEKNRADKPPEQ